MNNKTLVIAGAALLIGGVGYWAYTQGMFTINSLSPALTYCNDRGGVPEIIEEESGTTEVCHLEGGESCEAEAYFENGTCKPVLPQENVDGEGTPENGIEPTVETGPATEAVRAQVAAEAGVSADEVTIVSATVEEWSDGCLGLGGPAESCLAAITPGYRVAARVNDIDRVFRTNADGSVIREDSLIFPTN